MKAIVPVKRVVDPYVKIRVKPDGSGVDTANIKMAMNPFDEIAVEEAVRLKEAGKLDEIIVVTIGDSSSQETLRTALALGADRAILVEQTEHLEPLNIAKTLAALIQREQAQLIIMGKQAIDGDNNQTAQMLAGLLDWPQATFASALELGADNITVTREIDGGLETLALQLPAVISTDLRLNEPRYATLPNIMKAKRKPLESTSIADLNIEYKQHTTTLKVEPPPQRTAGEKVADVKTLVEKLRHEANVI